MNIQFHALLNMSPPNTSPGLATLIFPPSWLGTFREVCGANIGNHIFSGDKGSRDDFVWRISMKTTHVLRNLSNRTAENKWMVQKFAIFFDMLFLFQGLVISVAHFHCFLATSFLCWIPLPSNGNIRCGYMKSKAKKDIDNDCWIWGTFMLYGLLFGDL